MWHSGGPCDADTGRAAITTTRTTAHAKHESLSTNGSPYLPGCTTAPGTNSPAASNGPISERTREGLDRARASGRKLGRPKGSLGVSRLDGKEDEIRRRFLELGVSKTAIAKITGVSRTALYSFMSTRGLRPAP